MGRGRGRTVVSRLCLESGLRGTSSPVFRFSRTVKTHPFTPEPGGAESNNVPESDDPPPWGTREPDMVAGRKQPEGRSPLEE